jgi:hypothetical protein
MTTTPTVGSMYVTSAQTGKGRADAVGNPDTIDPNDNPVLHPASVFTVGESVAVVVQVSNPPPGRHHVSIGWFINGHLADLPLWEAISIDVCGARTVVFEFRPQQAGKWTARIYWDLPVLNRPSPEQAGAYLAREVAFDVQDGPTPTPLPTVVVTPGTDAHPVLACAATPTPAR